MKKLLGITASMLMVVFLLVGCSDPVRAVLTATETPSPAVPIVNGSGALCSDNIYVTYFAPAVMDSYSCSQDGMTIHSVGNKQVTELVTVSNFKPAIGDQVTVSYKFKKFDQGVESTIDTCEISTANELHKQSSTGQFVITALEKATYTISCPDGDSSIKVEFTLRTGE